LIDHSSGIILVKQHYAPEIDRRMRPHLKMSGTSYRLDEACVKVGKEWKYLYRTIDSTGRTIEFMLSARRDVSAAKRFFTVLQKADEGRPPAAAVHHRHG
jgi:transposase, IS6 family